MSSGFTALHEDRATKTKNTLLMEAFIKITNDLVTFHVEDNVLS